MFDILMVSLAVLSDLMYHNLYGSVDSLIWWIGIEIVQEENLMQENVQKSVQSV